MLTLGCGKHKTSRIVMLNNEINRGIAEVAYAVENNNRFAHL